MFLNLGIRPPRSILLSTRRPAGPSGGLAAAAVTSPTNPTTTARLMLTLD